MRYANAPELACQYDLDNEHAVWTAKEGFRLPWPGPARARALWEGPARDAPTHLLHLGPHRAKMATIHDLPQELIRHILLLAFLTEHQPRGHDPRQLSYGQCKRGLCQAALVHRSWTGPAQALLGHELEFDDVWDDEYVEEPEWLGYTHNIARISRGFVSDDLSWHNDNAEDLVRLLERARPGGVRRLSLLLDGSLPAAFFDQPGLSGEPKRVQLS
jgi:hypothetical protein